MRINRILLVPVGVSLLSCTLGGEISKPEIALGKSFSAGGTQSRANLWWQDFNDKKLDALIRLSLKNNKDLHSAWTRILQAGSLVRKTRADLYPALALSTGAERSRNMETESYSSAYNITLGTSYEVDLWGKIRSASTAQVHDYLASTRAYETAAVTISSQVAKTYYQLAENHRLQTVLNKQLVNSRQTHRLIKARFDAGEAGASDVLRQRQILEAIRGEKHLLSGSRTVLLNALKVLAGQSPAISMPKIYPRFANLKKIPRTGIPLELINRRPDMQSLWHQVLAAHNKIAVAKASRLPALTLSPDTSASSIAKSALFDNWMLSILGRITTSLFNAGKLKAEVNRARAAVAEKLSNYTQAALVAVKEVEDALALENSQRKYITSLNRQISDSRKILKQIKEEYVAGEKKYLDVLNAQNDLFSLERKRVVAIRQRIDYRIDLHKALAGGFMQAGTK